MPKSFLPTLIAVCLFLGGCAPVMSLFGLYDKDSLTNDDRIVGNWEILDETNKDKTDCCMVFAKSGDGYSMTVPDPENKETWYSVTHLVKLGDAMFVDIETDTKKLEKNSRVPFPVTNLHLFGRIWIEKDTIRMGLLDDDGMKKAVSSGKTRLTYVHADDLLLTSTTEQLQTFAREHVNDKDAFSFELNIRRKR
jgi:hypothetical protein